MDYTRQQMCGHKDYNLRTYTGNWREDVAREGDRMRNYLLKRASGELTGQKVQQRMSKALQPITLTPQHSDGHLRFGDIVMIQSAETKGVLSLDVETESQGRPGNFDVSVSGGCLPIARSVWTLMKAKDPNMEFYKKNKESDVVHYGQQLRLVNTIMGESNLSIASESQGPNTCLRGNKTGLERSEVTACVAGSLETLWLIHPAEVSWKVESEGYPVKTGDIVAFKAVKTNSYLSCEQGKKNNTFGFEEEVSTFHHKDQVTKQECKYIGARNTWGIVCAEAGSHFIPIHNGNQKSAIERVRTKILQRAGNLGFRGLTRSLRIMDDDGNKKLSRREFKEGLKVYGIHIDVSELDAVFNTFDRDGDGAISVGEFVRTIRGPMNSRRLTLVNMAYERIDTDKSGCVSFAELKSIYGQNLSQHPNVMSGSKTEREVLLEFISCWDKSGDGNVTPHEFQDYYNDISANIDNDDYFELMIRNAWHMSGGEGWCENTSCRRVLVIHNNGSQTVEEIENDLGIGPEDIDKMKEKLIEQGITDIKAIKLTF